MGRWREFLSKFGLGKEEGKGVQRRVALDMEDKGCFVDARSIVGVLFSVQLAVTIDG